jgi:hypothetical protein
MNDGNEDAEGNSLAEDQKRFLASLHCSWFGASSHRLSAAERKPEPKILSFFAFSASWREK